MSTSGRPGGVSRRQMASGTPNNSARETDRENGISHGHVYEKTVMTGERVRGVGVKVRERPSEKKQVNKTNKIIICVAEQIEGYVFTFYAGWSTPGRLQLP